MLCGGPEGPSPEQRKLSPPQCLLHIGKYEIGFGNCNAFIKVGPSTKELTPISDCGYTLRVKGPTIARFVRVGVGLKRNCSPNNQ